MRVLASSLGSEGSADKCPDFCLRQADQRGQLAEGQAELLAKLLCETDSPWRIKPARIACAVHLLANITADFPCLEVFHGDAPLLGHFGEHDFFSFFRTG